MNAELSAIIEDFELARERMRRVSAATPDDRWATRRDPARWSVAECIAHLNLTSRAYVPRLREALGAHPAAGPSTHRYRRDPMGWLVGAMSGPLPRIGRFKFGRTKTRPSFVPSGELGKSRLVEEFEALQDEQIALTRDAERRPLEAIRIVSPFEPRVSYNAYSCLWLLPRHQHRHLDQAAEVWADGAA